MDGGLAGLSRADRIAHLRARMEAVGATPAPDIVPDQGIPAPGGAHFSLVKRAVTHCSDTPALVVEIIRTAVRDGNFVAVVGWPELLLADVEEGLSNVVAIPDPGPDPLNTVAVLTEGMDLVIYRTAAPLQLSPVRARPLLGKLRKGNAALLLINVRAPSPHLTVQAQVRNFHGIGPGTGRIQGLEIEIAVSGKTGTRHTMLKVGEVAPRLRVV